MIGSRPNVLIVILDSARPGWLSCYDSSVGTSPNIDRIAREGIVFETAISPSVWTFPVMASVFTGMLPSKHGGHDEHPRLDTPYPTLAEVFERHGYDTAAFSDLPYVGPMTRLDRGFRTMCNMRAREVSTASRFFKGLARVHRTIWRRYLKTHETRIVIGEAIRWLKQGWDRNRPFLLYIHSDETHAPFLPPRRYRRRFAALSARRMHAINQDKHLYVGGAVSMSAWDFEDLRALALAEVAYFDTWLGRLLDHMGSGLLDDTVVVIAADHGDNLGEHGLLRHGLCLYDTLVNVPLIIKPPGRDAPARVKPMVQLIDLLPTLMGLASIDEPGTVAECQGRDLMAAIRTGGFAEFAVSELNRPDRRVWEKKVPHFMPEFREKYDRVLRSYRTNTHKLIWSSNGRHELYDLRADPAEERNLIHREPELATRMQQDLEAWLESFHHAVTTTLMDAEEADEQVMARLRDLGYVE